MTAPIPSRSWPRCRGPTRDLVKDRFGYGGITTVIREAMMDAAHGEAANEKARLKQSLEETRAEIPELERERTDLDDRIDEKEATAARLEDQLDAIRDREGEYEGALAIIEQDILEGSTSFRITPPSSEPRHSPESHPNRSSKTSDLETRIFPKSSSDPNESGRGE